MVAGVDGTEDLCGSDVLSRVGTLGEFILLESPHPWRVHTVVAGVDGTEDLCGSDVLSRVGTLGEFILLESLHLWNRRLMRRCCFESSIVKDRIFHMHSANSEKEIAAANEVIAHMWKRTVNKNNIETSIHVDSVPCNTIII